MGMSAIQPTAPGPRLSTAPKPHVPRLATALGGSLEACIHEILYVRSVYPRESFVPSRYLGVSCHASRHPGVVDYIYESLTVAVPAIVSGAGDEIALVITDFRGKDSGSNAERVLERFAFSFDVAEMAGSARALDGDEEWDRVGRLMRDLENGLRDVLLRIISMDGVDMGTRRGRLSGSTTFKLCLHTARREKVSESDAGGVRVGLDASGGLETSVVSDPKKDLSVLSCQELDRAIQKGAWFRSDTQSCSFETYEDPKDKSNGRAPRSKGLVRPLKNVNIPSCGLKMELSMEVTR